MSGLFLRRSCPPAQRTENAHEHEECRSDAEMERHVVLGYDVDGSGPGQLLKGDPWRPPDAHRSEEHHDRGGGG